MSSFDHKFIVFNGVWYVTEKELVLVREQYLAERKELNSVTEKLICSYREVIASNNLLIEANERIRILESFFHYIERMVEADRFDLSGISVAVNQVNNI